MKRFLMTSAALTLGLSALSPAIARADVRRELPDRPAAVVPLDYDHWREHRDEHRDDHRRDAYEVDVPVRDLPGRVLGTADRYGNGRHIESARMVHQADRTFYVVRMERRDKDDLTLRIERDGDLIDVQRH